MITKLDYLASQYRDSKNLRGVIANNLLQMAQVETTLLEVQKMLNLDTASGEILTLIGKIVGVGREYCGNMQDTLNLRIDRNIILNGKIEKIKLDDECMRKLIKVKIVKNSKKIVNFKELREIINIFFDDEIEIKIEDFTVTLKLNKNITAKIRHCLMLFRAFVPLPPTFKLYFYEDISILLSRANNISQIGVQMDMVEVQNNHLYLVELDKNGVYISQIGVQIDSVLVQK